MTLMRNLFYSIVVAVFMATIVSPAFCQDISAEGITAITRPSRDVTMSFVRPGQIAKVNVKDGDEVTAGQLLVQQDNIVELITLAQLQAKSTDTIPIEAARAELDQKKVDLEKLEWAAERGSATRLEVEHSRLAVKIAELSLKVAQFQHSQDIKKYEEFKALVERMNLKSPIAGRVEKISVEVGESVDTKTEVIRIVQIDPLWIDVPVPITRLKNLKLGQTAKVRFSDYDSAVGEGKIIFIAMVADAASSTLTVRLEMPNQELRPAGKQIRVLFAED